MFQPRYKTTLDTEYRGSRIHAVHYIPDIGVEVNGGFLGFYVDTASAKAAAETYIDRKIADQEKKQ